MASFFCRREAIEHLLLEYKSYWGYTDHVHVDARDHVLLQIIAAVSALFSIADRESYKLATELMQFVYSIEPTVCQFRIYFNLLLGTKKLMMLLDLKEGIDHIYKKFNKHFPVEGLSLPEQNGHKTTFTHHAMTSAVIQNRTDQADVNVTIQNFRDLFLPLTYFKTKRWLFFKYQFKIDFGQGFMNDLQKLLTMFLTGIRECLPKPGLEMLFRIQDDRPQSTCPCTHGEILLRHCAGKQKLSPDEVRTVFEEITSLPDCNVECNAETNDSLHTCKNEDKCHVNRSSQKIKCCVLNTSNCTTERYEHMSSEYVTADESCLSNHSATDRNDKNLTRNIVHNEYQPRSATKDTTVQDKLAADTANHDINATRDIVHNEYQLRSSTKDTTVQDELAADTTNHDNNATSNISHNEYRLGSSTKDTTVQDKLVSDTTNHDINATCNKEYRLRSSTKDKTIQDKLVCDNTNDDNNILLVKNETGKDELVGDTTNNCNTGTCSLSRNISYNNKYQFISSSKDATVGDEIAEEATKKNIQHKKGKMDTRFSPAGEQTPMDISLVKRPVNPTEKDPKSLQSKDRQIKQNTMSSGDNTNSVSKTSIGRGDSNNDIVKLTAKSELNPVRQLVFDYKNDTREHKDANAITLPRLRSQGDGKRKVNQLVTRVKQNPKRKSVLDCKKNIHVTGIDKDTKMEFNDSGKNTEDHTMKHEKEIKTVISKTQKEEGVQFTKYEKRLRICTRTKHTVNSCYTQLKNQTKRKAVETQNAMNVLSGKEIGPNQNETHKNSEKFENQGKEETTVTSIDNETLQEEHLYTVCNTGKRPFGNKKTVRKPEDTTVKGVEADDLLPSRSDCFDKPLADSTLLPDEHSMDYAGLWSDTENELHGNYIHECMGGFNRDSSMDLTDTDSNISRVFEILDKEFPGDSKRPDISSSGQDNWTQVLTGDKVQDKHSDQEPLLLQSGYINPDRQCIGGWLSAEDDSVSDIFTSNSSQFGSVIAPSIGESDMLVELDDLVSTTEFFDQMTNDMVLPDIAKLVQSSPQSRLP